MFRRVLRRPRGRAIRCGTRFPRRPAQVYDWPDSRPTSPSRRSSKASACSRAHDATSRARACSASSATRSRPTTSARPAAIKPTSPAGKYLQEHGVAVADFNTYGARRGNHEVMMRGTFANVRIKNLMAARHAKAASRSTSRAASRCRSTKRRCATRREGVPLVVFGGDEYGTGSSRDWAAKGTAAPRREGGRSRATSSASTARTWSAWACCRCQFKGGDSVAVAQDRRRRDVRPRRPRAGDLKPLQDVTIVIRRKDGARGGGAGLAADRYADRGRLLPARRDPALRAARAAGESRLTSRAATTNPRGPRAPAADLA